jgi:hypothetical protein
VRWNQMPSYLYQSSAWDQLRADSSQQTLSKKGAEDLDPTLYWPDAQCFAGHYTSCPGLEFYKVCFIKSNWQRWHQGLLLQINLPHLFVKWSITI